MMRSVAINYAEYEKEPSGKVELIGRVKYVAQSAIYMHAYAMY